MNIDLMSISGHKIYGPKGIGALYVRRKPRVRLVPLIVGGGQERGFRSGHPGRRRSASASGEAAEIAMKEMDAEVQAAGQAAGPAMLKGLNDKLTDIHVNGDLETSHSGQPQHRFSPMSRGESLMMGHQGPVRCRPARPAPRLRSSPAMCCARLGVEEDMAHTSLAHRPWGRFTTEQEVDTAVDELVRHVKKLRAMSPLWEMAQEGVDYKVDSNGPPTNSLEIGPRRNFEERVMGL